MWRSLALCLLLVGCGKQSGELQTTKVPGTNASENNSASNSEADVTAQLAQLTQTVRKYGVEQRRAPKNLDELVAAGYLSSIPLAPSGKKFAINKNLEVYLAPR
jgi:hypothetical protein